MPIASPVKAVNLRCKERATCFTCKLNTRANLQQQRQRTTTTTCNNNWAFLGKIRWKIQQNPAPNLIQFQFLMPVIIKDFFMFTASNDQCNESANC